MIHWIVDDYHIRYHQGLEENEGEQIAPLEMYQQGLENEESVIFGQPILPSSLDDLRFDVLNYEKHGISRNGIKMFGMEYNASFISKLLGIPNASKKDYIIRYDPRNILEIYIYSEI